MIRTLLSSALLLLSGCALNSEVRHSDEPDAALIFGFFDMKEAPFELGCVRITQDEKKGIAYLRPKSLHFYGAFKYKVVNKELLDVFKPDQYGLKPVSNPGEKAVLRMLQDRVQDPRWKARIKARLAE
jgi:hypothetical protein